jgi:hypothetical protein
VVVVIGGVIRMSLQEILFTFALLFAAVVIAVMGGAAVYVAVRNRRIRRETGREVGTADPAVVTARDEPAESPTQRAAPPAPPRREFYKSRGLVTHEEDTKVRLYSIEQYRDELGGTVAREDGFVGALRAYRWFEVEWYDYSPRKAADVLELAPEDYEVDEERSALLLRRLPPGLPVSARDVL